MPIKKEVLSFDDDFNPSDFDLSEPGSEHPSKAGGDFSDDESDAPSDKSSSSDDESVPDDDDLRVDREGTELKFEISPYYAYSAAFAKKVVYWTNKAGDKKKAKKAQKKHKEALTALRAGWNKVLATQKKKNSEWAMWALVSDCYNAANVFLPSTMKNRKWKKKSGAVCHEDLPNVDLSAAIEAFYKERLWDKVSTRSELIKRFLAFKIPTKGKEKKTAPKKVCVKAEDVEVQPVVPQKQAAPKKAPVKVKTEVQPIVSQKQVAPKNDKKKAAPKKAPVKAEDSDSDDIQFVAFVTPKKALVKVEAIEVQPTASKTDKKKTVAPKKADKKPKEMVNAASAASSDNESIGRKKSPRGSVRSTRKK